MRNKRILQHLMIFSIVFSLCTIFYYYFKVSGLFDSLTKALLQNKENPFIRDYLIPPSNLPYNLINPELDPSMGQSIIIKLIFNNKRNLFFVEAGALDGETRSNTLSLEKDFGWKGLLIEADPENFKLLKTKNRKAWTSNTCLSTKKYLIKVLFEQKFNLGKISAVTPDSNANKENKRLAPVTCFPFEAYMKALNVSVVDFFSLDVEGDEMKILKTIPFKSIYIKVLTVEYIHNPNGRMELVNFMRENDYYVISQVVNRNNQANDFIFVHKSIKLNQYIPNLLKS